MTYRVEVAIQPDKVARRTGTITAYHGEISVSVTVEDTADEKVHKELARQLLDKIAMEEARKAAEEAAATSQLAEITAEESRRTAIREG